MQIKDLPFGVVFKLCRQLDSPHADRFSWRALLSHVPRESASSLSLPLSATYNLSISPTSALSLIPSLSLSLSLSHRLALHGTGRGVLPENGRETEWQSN